MTLLVFYVLLALGVSFLCSILEATLLTLSPSAIESAKERGASWATLMEKHKRDIDRPLSAILTLNTIAHTMGAAGAGAQYIQVYGNAFEAAFAAALTLAILIFTEIIPKTLGARYASALAGPSSVILSGLIVILAPVVWGARQITRLITFGRSVNQHTHREELLAMARLGEETGQLQSRESTFVQNVIQLHRMKTWDIMTPRPVIFAVPASMPLKEFVGRLETKPFSRIPVYGTDTDDVRGFVLRSEVLLAMLKGPADISLEPLIRPIAVTSEDVALDELFQRFITERQHIMLVTDDFGTTVGLVTLEDLLETIFGFEIMDEMDKVEDLQALARKLWQQRAKRMGIRLPEESEPEVREPAPSELR